ncbi:hypothetical protein JCGZ_10854 [Jatropha curcas]|uniref:Transcription repressor n=1 Tax=Jatropha curcas TaxID=180498 RepID=A0A067KGU4_JATCU|nr:hypothetical protein JCGZ_10854 [Jatropha curcas]
MPNKKSLKTMLIEAKANASCKSSYLHEPTPNPFANSKTKISSAASKTEIHENKCPKALIMIKSIAMVKNSQDPYKDFRHSMLQMIFEKEIYAKDDLQHLLYCFLELNSPCQHPVIIKAFTDICNIDVISPNHLLNS